MPIRIQRKRTRGWQTPLCTCAIGVELEERYAEIAAKRLQQDALPFGDVDGQTVTWRRL